MTKYEMFIIERENILNLVKNGCDMEKLCSMLNQLYKKIDEFEDELVYEDLLDIGKDNYKSGYGAIAIAIQKKYNLSKKNLTDISKKIVEPKVKIKNDSLSKYENDKKDSKVYFMDM